MSRCGPRWGVLISGRGSNLGALLELGDEFDARIVISSSPTAYGLTRARRHGVPCATAPLLPNSKKIDWQALDDLLVARGVTHVFLAGFMKIVPADFVSRWAGRILNLHPSILPSYPGLQSIQRAHADRADVGVTIHEVDEGVDTGSMLSQRRCLKAHEVSEYSLDLTEFLVHVDEQRLVREAVRKWKR